MNDTARGFIRAGQDRTGRDEETDDVLECRDQRSTPDCRVHVKLMRDTSLYSDPKLKAFRQRFFKQVGKQTTMMEDIYDATLIHEQEHNDVRIDGETACPNCGERVFPDMSDDVFNAALESRIAAPFDCPECSASLEFIIEPTPTEELGLGLWLVPQWNGE